MKKIIFTLVLTVLALDLMAQEHLSFKGISIEGSITEFCQKLEEKGCSLITSENNNYLYRGDFTGRSAIICVMASSDEKNVHAVAASFEPNKEWNNLVNTYDYYKDLYTRKYGEPTLSKENNPSPSKTNFYLMDELYQGTVEYVSEWEASGGVILLAITKSERVYHEGMVTILYLDAQSTETKIQKDLEDI